jgi:hypothetical protein
MFQPGGRDGVAVGDIKCAAVEIEIHSRGDIQRGAAGFAAKERTAGRINRVQISFRSCQRADPDIGEV